MMKILKALGWFLYYLQSGRKGYLFCLALGGAVAYVHLKRPELFGFTNKELFYIGSALAWAFLNRNVQQKIHGSKLSRLL